MRLRRGTRAIRAAQAPNVLFVFIFLFFFLFFRVAGAIKARLGSHKLRRTRAPPRHVLRVLSPRPAEASGRKTHRPLRIRRPSSRACAPPPRCKGRTSAWLLSSHAMSFCLSRWYAHQTKWCAARACRLLFPNDCESADNGNVKPSPSYMTSAIMVSKLAASDATPFVRSSLHTCAWSFCCMSSVKITFFDVSSLEQALFIAFCMSLANRTADNVFEHMTSMLLFSLALFL